MTALPSSDNNPPAEVVQGGTAWGDRFGAVLGMPTSPGWLTADELFGPDLPATLAAVGVASGTRSPAVSGALLFEQYAGHLVAPVLAALYRRGAVLDGRRSMVRVKVVDGAVRRIAFARPPTALGEGDDGRPEMLAALIGGNLEPAALAVHRHTRAGRRVLHGAIANAVASAFLHLSWPDPDPARHVSDARALLGCVPEIGDLVTVDAVCVAGRPWMYYARRSCCQAFRTPAYQARELRFCSSCPVLPEESIGELFVRATQRFATRACR